MDFSLNVPELVVILLSNGYLDSAGKVRIAEMKQMIKAIQMLVLLLLILASCNNITEQVAPKTDADRIRDVHYIAELAEQYKEKTGSYPYHHWFEDVEEGHVAVPVGVNITNQKLPESYRYPPPGVSGYIDPVEEFLEDLRYVLGKNVKLPYDDKPVVYEPPYIPTFYQYHYDGENYYVSAILTKPNQYTRELSKGFYKYQVGSVEDKELKIRNYTQLRKQLNDVGQ